MLEWFHRVRVIQVDDRVELVDESCSEVVAVALGLGAVDHADGALEARVAQRGAGGRGRSREPEAFDADVVEQLLVAPVERRSDPLALWCLAPVRRGGDVTRRTC